MEHYCFISRYTQQRRKYSKKGVKIGESIIKKYAAHAEVLISGKLLPVPSNQKMNAYLKELASICCIDKDLHTHLARHTYATTVTLSNGIPIETVSKLLGHKSITTTQIYAQIVDSKKVAAVNSIPRINFS